MPESKSIQNSTATMTTHYALLNKTTRKLERWARFKGGDGGLLLFQNPTQALHWIERHLANSQAFKIIKAQKNQGRTPKTERPGSEKQKQNRRRSTYDEQNT